MEEISIFSILMLAFGFGLLHALDADHIITVTGLTTLNAGFRQSLFYCLRWALGHSLTLIIIVMSIVLLGMSLPQQFSQFAEFLIGIILFVIGIKIYTKIKKQNLHIHYHQHDELPRHSHWHSHDHSQKIETQHDHQHHATLIGSIHGMAGSASILALIPATNQLSAWSMMSFIFMFCIGTVIAMLVFGGAMSSILGGFLQKQKQYINYFRAILGTVSIGIGSFIILNNVQL